MDAPESQPGFYRDDEGGDAIFRGGCERWEAHHEEGGDSGGCCGKEPGPLAALQARTEEGGEITGLETRRQTVVERRDVRVMQQRGHGDKILKAIAVQAPMVGVHQQPHIRVCDLFHVAPGLSHGRQDVAGPFRR